MTDKRTEISKIIETMSNSSSDVDNKKVTQTNTKSTLTNMQEFKLKQNLIAELKFIMSFDCSVLREQKYYWMVITPIEDSDVQQRIKSNLESHHKTPIVWISSSEILVDINPDHRLPGAKALAALSQQVQSQEK